MLKRNWIKHPAFGVAIFAILGFGAIALNNQNQKTSYSYAKHTKAEFQYSVPIGTTFRNAPLPKESPNREEWREEKDLEAQWIMAVFTFAIAFLTFMGVVLLARTLKATRDAVNAAHEAVEAQERIGTKQTQAYLSVESAVVRLRRHQTAPGPAEWGINVEILIKNYGHSPAKKVSIECTRAFIWAVATGNSELGLFASDGAFIGYHEFTQDTFSSDIAPGAVEPARMYSDLLSAEHTDKLLHRQNKVDVKGKIKWTTEFDDERTFSFHIETAPFVHSDLLNDDGSPNPNRVILMDRLPQQHPTEEPQNA